MSGRLYCQNFSIGGSIKDASNGETVIGATILLKEVNKATSTNQYGFFFPLQLQKANTHWLFLT